MGTAFSFGTDSQHVNFFFCENRGKVAQSSKDVVEADVDRLDSATITRPSLHSLEDFWVDSLVLPIGIVLLLCCFMAMV